MDSHLDSEGLSLPLWVQTLVSETQQDLETRQRPTMKPITLDLWKSGGRRDWITVTALISKIHRLVKFKWIQKNFSWSDVTFGVIRMESPGHAMYANTISCQAFMQLGPSWHVGGGDVAVKMSCDCCFTMKNYFKKIFYQSDFQGVLFLLSFVLRLVKSLTVNESCNFSSKTVQTQTSLLKNRNLQLTHCKFSQFVPLMYYHFIQVAELIIPFLKNKYTNFENNTFHFLKVFSESLKTLPTTWWNNNLCAPL